MTIRSSTLSASDYSCFVDNFKVINSNVESLEEADCILFGESHDSDIDYIKNLWLFNRLVKANDKFFIEGSSGRLKVYHSVFFPFLPPTVELQGWDSEEIWKKIRQMMSKFDKILSLFEECANAPSKNLLFKTVREVNRLANHDVFKNSLLQIRELNPPYTKRDLRLIVGDVDCVFEGILGIQRKIADQAKINELSDEELKKISDAELNHFFSIFHDRVHVFLILHYAFISDIFITSLRNVSLARSITKPCEKGKKHFFLAGKGHLRPGKRIGTMLGYEALKRALNQRKFVILTPTKDEKDLTVMCDDLENQRKRRYRTPVICSVAISVLFGMIGGYAANGFLRMACAGISLGSLGLLANHLKNTFVGTPPQNKEKYYDYRFFADLPNRFDFLNNKISNMTLSKND